MKDGRTLTGIIRADTKVALTVVTVNDVLTLPRQEVETLTVSSYSAAWSAIGLAAIVGLGLWTIVAGASMIAHPEVETVARHRSMIAASH